MHTQKCCLLAPTQVFIGVPVVISKQQQKRAQPKTRAKKTTTMRVNQTVEIGF